MNFCDRPSAPARCALTHRRQGAGIPPSSAAWREKPAGPGFDIQQEAVEQTKALLEREGLRAEVYLDSHANMARYVQPETVDCVVFNFGRLPGGDRRS